MTDAEMQLAGLFAKYDPAVAALGKSLRAKLRARLPGLTEIVYWYEGQRSLVISYSPTDQGYAGVCTLALRPEQVKLFFAGGPKLSKSDPGKLLQGSGKTARYVAMAAAADLDRDEIEALLAAALELAKVRPVAGAKGAMILKSEEQKKRAVRAKKATRPAKGGRAAQAKR